MIKDYWEIRDIKHHYKTRFLIPNLYRKENKKVPHASYRNRGRYKRYMKIHMRKYDKVMGYVEY